jgi:hypothetical protein
MKFSVGLRVFSATFRYLTGHNKHLFANLNALAVETGSDLTDL